MVQRAANGVVIITTKRGKITGKAKIDYSGNVGFVERVRKLDMLSAEKNGSTEQLKWSMQSM